MENNETFCVLPWIHLHAWPNGKVYPCCISSIGKDELQLGDLTTQTISEIINSDASKFIRKEMLEGKQIPSCKNCYNVEKYKGFSWRNDFNTHFGEYIPDIIKNTQSDGTIDPNLLYLDFRFSNFCNLGCRTCGAELSSTIGNTPGRELPRQTLIEYQKQGIINQNNVISFSNVKPSFISDDLEQYLKDIKCFYFAGGEPLIQKEHFDILSYLHKEKWFDKELRYSSNMSTLKYKSHNLLDYWKDFERIRFMASIDHYGDKLEFIRKNVISDRVFDNLETVIDYQFLVSINTVVSIYNIYYLYDFYEFLDQKGYIDKLDRIDILYAFGEMHTPAILPDFAKIELLEKLKKDSNSKLYKKLFKKWPSFESTIQGLPKFIADGSNKFDEFLNFTKLLDNSYNDLSSTFPWLGSVIDRYYGKK
jgi:radical SAM protein with 4Fe4S-binding SPASM domain